MQRVTQITHGKKQKIGKDCIARREHMFGF